MQLQGKKAIILAEKFYEDLELWYPLLRLREEGASVRVIGPEANATYQSKHGYPVTSDATPADINPEDVDCLIIPGGYAPDHIRRHPEMIQLVAAVAAKGAKIGFICHGGWVSASADIVRGRKITSFFAIKDDMVNAGAEWVDAEVVCDGNLISSRTPHDLPAFCKAIINAL